jgi:predicted ATPase/DNA-binding XRE family transcriptional regulator
MTATRDPGVFAALIRHYRVAAGLSQEALAERAGISARGLSDLERGLSRAPRLSTLARLADALGLDPARRTQLLEASGRLPRSEPTAAAAMPAQPPLARPRQADANLPGYLTGLLGRHEDEFALAGMVEQDHIRLVTLLGPGGVGKTRLAVHVADGLRHVFRDGVVFVPLAGVNSTALLLGTLGHALGLSETFEVMTLDSLVRALVGLRMLLVMDNFEHLVDAAPRVGELLVGCPELQVLATSRRRLAISGEHLYFVRPLPVPSYTPGVEAASHWPGVAMFVQRAHAVQPDFALSPANVGAVVGICQRLDGLPLALELAAARLTTLSPAALLERLQNPISILTGGARDSPTRHQTLQATVAWSYALLAEPHQLLLQRLAIFAGEASLDAVKAVCPDWTELDVLDGISELADASFIEMTSIGDEPRFRMLETIRDFALERLHASGEEAGLRSLQLDFLIGVARAAEEQLIGPGQFVWSARLRREIPNLRLALEWAIEHAPSRGLRLVSGLRFFWYVAGYQREACEWLATLLDDRSQQPEDTLERAWAVLALGYLRTMLAEYRLATFDLERGLGIGRRLSDQRVIAFALRFLGAIANASGDYTAARGHLQTSLSIYEALGLTPDAIVVRMFLGDTALHQGELESAWELFEDCRQLLEATGNAGTLAYPVRRLALLATRGGDFAQAARLYAESLSLARDIAQHQGIAACAVGLADLAARQHQDVRATFLLGATDAYLIRVGARLAYSADRDQLRDALSTVRQRLPPAAFDNAWREGQACELEDALQAHS